MPTVNLTTKYLEDAQGNKYAPVTVPSAVRWPNGDDLDDKLGNIPTYSAGTNININNGVISAKGLPVGAGTVTSLANLPVTNRLIYAEISTNQSVVSINGGLSSLPAGYELHVIIYADGGDINIVLPTATPYTPTNYESTLTIKDDYYGEINFVSDGTNIWVRGIAE